MPLSCDLIVDRTGALSIMVGGEAKHFKTCLPVMEAIGSRIEHMGPSGAGAAAKLVNQVYDNIQRYI